MTSPVTMSPEQFAELLEEVKGRAAPRTLAGLGGVGAQAGLGCESGGMDGPIALGVEQLLIAGSPRLALARAEGYRFAPYVINIRGTFNTGDTDVPMVSNDRAKFSQDTLITRMMVRIINGNPPVDAFTSLADWFYNFQSGIDATLDVVGTPGYSVAPDFVPLANLCDAVNGSGFWPDGWIMTYQQQLKMSFHANVPIPATSTPLQVNVTFRAWIPQGERFVGMRNDQAFELLAKCGYACPDDYVNYVCNQCK